MKIKKGKVKDPSVCPNLHAFCSLCIATWLEKAKQCPTCRVPITNEAPCRRILGGLDNADDVDKLKPVEFSHASVRKARFQCFFQEYEDEIDRLNAYADSLYAEIAKLKVVLTCQTSIIYLADRKIAFFWMIYFACFSQRL